MLEEEGKLEEPLSQASMSTLNTHNGAWTNREEMWTIEDKKMLFTTKSDQSTSEWIDVLDQLLNDEIANFSN